MKTKILLALAIVTPALAFVACGGSNDSNNTGITACQYNSYGQPIGNCTTQFTNSTSMIGYYSENAYTQTMSFSDATIPGTSNSTGQLSSAARTEFLRRSMGVCDQASLNGGSSGGLAGCNAWSQGGMALVMQFSDPSSITPKLTFKAFPQQNAFSWYSYQLPSFSQLMMGFFGFPVFTTTGITRNPLEIFKTTMNKAQYGYELRAYSTEGNYAWANPQLLQVFLYGAPGASSIPYAVAYYDPNSKKNLPFATGTLRRCAEPSCIQGVPW